MKSKGKGRMKRTGAEEDTRPAVFEHEEDPPGPLSLEERTGQDGDRAPNQRGQKNDTVRRSSRTCQSFALSMKVDRVGKGGGQAGGGEDAQDGHDVQAQVPVIRTQLALVLLDGCANPDQVRSGREVARRGRERVRVGTGPGSSCDERIVISISSETQ